MRWRNRNRWGDNDRNFGPFTYARDERGYRPLAIMLKSPGDDPDETGDCTLRVSGFGHTFISTLPQVIRPWRRWVDTSKYAWSKGPSSGYWDTHAREYGFSLSGAGTVGGGAFLQVHFGPQTGDSTTTKDWCKTLPWTDWRHVRHSLYGLDGEHVWTEPKRVKGMRGFELLQEAEEACPSRTFAFRDFDGEALTCRTMIEEREWRFGGRRFEWLSVFRRPIVQRSLDLKFSGETGKRKGSWKGGTVGHGIAMLPGELHEAAFRRYCAEHDMMFDGEVPAGPATPSQPAARGIGG